MATFDFDAIVVGGGVAGASTAALMAEAGFAVCLLDQRMPSPPADETSPRVVALSLGSQRILNHTGAWSMLGENHATPYGQMRVESGQGVLRFKADEHGLPALGWIVEIPRLQHALWRVLKDNPNVTIQAPSHWHDWTPIEGGARIRLADDRGDLTASQTTRVLIAADGAQSRLRQSAGIETTQWDYNQQALIGPVTTETANPGMAWQRFTPLGPLALLPLPNGQSSIVWSIPNTEADRLAKLDGHALVATINDVLADSQPHATTTHPALDPITPMGALTQLHQAHWLPLKRIRANRLIGHPDHGPLVLVGDAGHSVHPLAGQGLNMGLADAAALVECLAEADQGTDLASEKRVQKALVRYNRWRLSASTLNASGIHFINEISRAPMGLGKHSLGLSFMLANRLWPVREAMIQTACGIDRDSPTLAQGRLPNPSQRSQ